MPTEHLRAFANTLANQPIDRYSLRVKIPYLFAVLGVTGLATVRKSKRLCVPSGSSGRADQPPRSLGFQRPHGRL